MSACPPLDREIDFGFGSIVRAGEAKLCERVSEKAPLVPRENPPENCSGCVLVLLVLLLLLRLWVAVFYMGFKDFVSFLLLCAWVCSNLLIFASFLHGF